MLELDKKTEDIINGPYKHGRHNVHWHVIKKDKEVDTKLSWPAEKLKRIAHTNKSGVCYATLTHDLERYNYNIARYIATTIPLDGYPLSILTKKEIVQWLILCKKHKLLPRYVCPENMITEDNVINGVFKLKGITSRAHLYLYLSVLRHIKEDPGLPKIVIHLTKNLGLDFFAALAVGNYHGVLTSGHNILEYIGPYPQPQSVKTHKYNLKSVKELKLYVQSPIKYREANNLFVNSRWLMTQTLNSTKVQHFVSTFNDLDSDKTKNYLKI